MSKRNRQLMPNSWKAEWTNICYVLGRYSGWENCKLTADKEKVYHANFVYQKAHS